MCACVHGFLAVKILLSFGSCCQDVSSLGRRSKCILCVYTCGNVRLECMCVCVHVRLDVCGRTHVCMDSLLSRYFIFWQLLSIFWQKVVCIEITKEIT